MTSPRGALSPGAHSDPSNVPRPSHIVVADAPCLLAWRVGEARHWRCSARCAEDEEAAVT